LGLAKVRSLTLLRLEGVAPSVAHRKAALMTAMKIVCERRSAQLRCATSPCRRKVWRSVRDVAPFAAMPEMATRPVWRIVTAPSRGAELAGMIVATTEAEKLETEVLYDWAGGLVWVMLAPSDEAGAALVRRAVGACGDRPCSFVRPPPPRRRRRVFPQEPGLASLTRRVKHGFDPNGVLNLGSDVAGV